MSNDKYTHDNRLFIPNTGIVCRALVSWIANQGTISVVIVKNRSMLHVNFPDLPPGKHEEAREFINNYIK